ncbi:MAG: DUF2934 domain-containing protein [Chthoniobacterales bacterium]
MAKSSKKTKDVATPEPTPGTPQQAAESGAGGAQIRKPVRAQRGAKKTPARGKSAGKTSSAAAPRTPQAKARKKLSAGPTISDEAIRMRAYFISEWRAENSVSGDSAHDWLEAVRQLQEEARQTA